MVSDNALEASKASFLCVKHTKTLICNLSSEKGSSCPFSFLTVTDKDKSGFSLVENTLLQLPHCLLRQTDGILRLGRLISTDVSDWQKGHFIFLSNNTKTCTHVYIALGKNRWKTCGKIKAACIENLQAAAVFVYLLVLFIRLVKRLSVSSS